MGNARKICPLCRHNCNGDNIIILTNNRACHGNCVMDKWGKVVEIRERAKTHAEREFPKNNLYDDLKRELKEADDAILQKKIILVLLNHYLVQHIQKNLLN
jgi:nickel-dependent lactate racemase